MKSAAVKRPNNWLNQCAKNVTSQGGEDGIIEKILEVLNIDPGWCVEFGAWDGTYLSNINNLIANKDFSAVMIEGDSTRYQDLVEYSKVNNKVTPINALVGFSEDDGLDSILKSTKIPADFDLLSIDIDGNDYHVWEALRHYRPKVVLIEYNPTIPSPVEFVQPRDMSVMQGSSLLSITKLAKQKGYELVATTKFNGVFVDAKYFSLFGIEDNSVEALRTDNSTITYIFHGYDGTVFVKGHRKLVWHGIPFSQSHIQPLPKWLRRFPGQYSRPQRVLAKIYKALRS